MIHTGVVAHVQRLWERRAEPPAQAAQATDDTSARLKLAVLEIDQTLPTPVIQVNCALDRRTMAALIDCAVDLYANGARRLLVDLSATPRIELSGLFALHSIARLYHGEPLPNPEDGWAVLHQAADPLPTSLGDQVKLVAPPAIAHLIAHSEVCQSLAIYPDVASAVFALSQNEPV